MKEIEVLIRRLGKLGISLEIDSNIPWVYIRSINGKVVEEKWWSEHGCAIILGEKLVVSYRELFTLIKKYK